MREDRIALLAEARSAALRAIDASKEDKYGYSTLMRVAEARHAVAGRLDYFDEALEKMREGTALIADPTLTESARKLGVTTFGLEGEAGRLSLTACGWGRPSLAPQFIFREPEPNLTPHDKGTSTRVPGVGQLRERTIRPAYGCYGDYCVLGQRALFAVAVQRRTVANLPHLPHRHVVAAFTRCHARRGGRRPNAATSRQFGSSWLNCGSPSPLLHRSTSCGRSRAPSHAGIGPAPFSSCEASAGAARRLRSSCRESRTPRRRRRDPMLPHQRPLRAAREHDDRNSAGAQVLLVTDPAVGGEQDVEACLFCSAEQRAVAEGVPASGPSRVNGVPGQRVGQSLRRAVVKQH